MEHIALTDGIQWMQQEMAERKLAILGNISKVAINNRKYSCSMFPASSYCQEQAAQCQPGLRIQLVLSFYQNGSCSRLCYRWNPAIPTLFQLGTA